MYQNQDAALEAIQEDSELIPAFCWCGEEALDAE
jgi:hypothetical protein